MDMSGTRRIAAPRETVWERLNDADTLRACIPGCEALSGNAQDGFEATVKQKVGPVKATFKGAVAVTDAVPPESYRIAGEGKGGVAGFAKGGADVRLAEVEGGTELTYAVQAKVGGKIAQLGSRLIDSFAAKMADEFFDRFRAEVEGPGAVAEPATPDPQDPVT
jgi:carbon monoxide dehydrogenase subunit G